MIPVGPDPGSVVQVRARPSFGSGYLIGPGLVLTAAHVLLTADGVPSDTITVRAPGAPAAEGAETPAVAEGRVIWWRKDDQADAALVQFAPSDGTPAPAAATRFGSFVTAEPGQPVEAIGFPRLQKFASLRDQEHFVGALSPQTSAISGHYELTSRTPLPAQPPDDFRTPWAGMSGSAVFSAGLLTGVVRADRRAHAGARLTATPIAGLLADPGFRRAAETGIGHGLICEPAELSGVLESYVNRDVRSVASVLRADAEVVEFHGRDAELERLAAWCEGPEPLSVLIVTGQGGAGKSRLALEFLARRRSQGWTTGMLASTVTDAVGGEEQFAPVARTTGPLLIAVDYAENNARQVRFLLRQALAAAAPVRLLLLARGRGAWCEEPDDPDARIRDLLARAPELPLGPLAPPATAGWDDSFGRALRDIAQVLPSVLEHEHHDWTAAAARVVPPSAETDRQPDSALAIQMMALTRLLQQVVPVDSEPGEPAERTLLRHEEAYWKRTALRHGLRDLDRITMRGAVAALPLVTVVDQEQAARLAGALGAGGRAATAAEWLRALYPAAGNRYLGSMQPDRIAEFLLVEACAQQPDLLARIASAAPGLGDPEQLAFLESEFGPGSAPIYGQMRMLLESVRAARSQAYFGNPAGPLLAQIERTASGPAIPEEALSWALANVRTLPEAGKRQDVTEQPDGGLLITGLLDAASAALIMAGYRRGVDNIVASDDERSRGLAYMVRSMNVAQLGRYEEALEISALAVRSFRSAPDAADQLRMELSRQAALLLALNRDAEAAEALRESVALRAGEDRDTAEHRETLADDLDKLIAALCRTGQFAEAVGYARQETGLRRPESPAPAQKTAQAYVHSLGRCAELLESTGDYRAALDYCGQAEEFLSTLPRGTAEALGGDRAMLAGIRASALSASGNPARSAAAWEESAAAWRGLDGSPLGADPGSREVSCLNNAAVQLHRHGDLGRALEDIHAAVEVALGDRGESLLRDRPDRYQEVHATYAGYLVQAGDPVRGLAEAERLSEWTATAPGARGLPVSCAIAMAEAAPALVRGGHPAEAARASDIAVAALGEQVGSDDDLNVFVHVAAKLTDVAVDLAESESYAAGARVAADAAKTWRLISVGAPQAWINMVRSLANQAECLRASEQYEQAIAIYAEAAGELRRSPDDNSGLADMLLQGKAKAYTGLAMQLRQHRSPTDALDAAERALDVFARLHRQNPGSDWDYVVRAYMVTGATLLEQGEPVPAAGALIHAMAHALQHNARDLADACYGGIQGAHMVDPSGVAAIWQRMVGSPYPGA